MKKVNLFKLNVENIVAPTCLKGKTEKVNEGKTKTKQKKQKKKDREKNMNTNRSINVKVYRYAI